FSAAIDAFRKALQKRQNPQWLYAVATLHDNLGEATEAMKAFEELTKQTLPKPVMVRVQLGLARNADFLGETTAAIEAYKKVIKEDPSLEDPFIGLLKLMRRTGFSKGVDKIREKGLPYHGDKFTFHFWLGNLYYEIGDDKNAMEAFQKCIELKPENSSPYYFIYKIQRKSQKIEEAISFLEKFYLNNPLLPYMFFEAALDARTENRLDLAFKFLRASILQDRLLLGRDDRGTIVAVERYVEKNGSAEEKLFLKPFMMFVNSEFRPASTEARRVLPKLKDKLLRDDAERIIRHATQFVAGEDAYNEYVSHMQSEQEAAMAALKQRMAQGKVAGSPDDKFGEIKRRALANPRDAKLQYGTALELARGGDLDGAKLFLRETLRANPFVSEAYYSLAKIAEVEGDQAEIMRALQQALKINPNNSQARSMLAASYLAAGDFEQAVGEARSALLANPNNGEARLILARINIQNQRSEEALNEIELGLMVERDPVRKDQLLALKQQVGSR
ncbi:MAG TPA: tetratricopeptide repeat protein, partial [Candidatus Ozemobacteraceae bacterium]|nr:tetratricopeptide repeat protein [Candidatus Ozemobacteraceae bacterium]